MEFRRKFDPQIMHFVPFQEKYTNASEQLVSVLQQRYQTTEWLECDPNKIRKSLYAESLGDKAIPFIVNSWVNTGKVQITDKKVSTAFSIAARCVTNIYDQRLFDFLVRRGNISLNKRSADLTTLFDHLNETSTSPDLIGYVCLLRILNTTTELALDPLKDRVTHLSNPQAKITFSDPAEEVLRKIFQQTEPYFYFANQLAANIQKIETGLFVNNPNEADLWTMLSFFQSPNGSYSPRTLRIPVLKNLRTGNQNEAWKIVEEEYIRQPNPKLFNVSLLVSLRHFIESSKPA